VASLTIAEMDDGLAARLRKRAAAHGRSVEAEALDILRSGVGAPAVTQTEIAVQMAQWAAASEAVVARFGAPGDEYAPF
jgi:plasmid stability protein